LKDHFGNIKQGTHRYIPYNYEYLINSIKGKTYSAYHILAYSCNSWSLAIPELVPQLNLPYKAEYKIALKINKSS
jgi:hypothetical protein